SGRRGDRVDLLAARHLGCLAPGRATLPGDPGLAAGTLRESSLFSASARDRGAKTWRLRRGTGLAPEVAPDQRRAERPRRHGKLVPSARENCGGPRRFGRGAGLVQKIAP